MLDNVAIGDVGYRLNEILPGETPNAITTVISDKPDLSNISMTHH